MTIRILNHNGTAHQLSARMNILFQHELRRIGETPSSSTVTVNLWVSNQTPEELLEILKRIPDHDSGASRMDEETQVPHSETSGTKHGEENLEAAPAPTNHPTDITIAGTPMPNAGTNVQLATAPQSSIFGKDQFFESGRRFNSVYQRETGHIFADPFGVGELANLPDGRTVNLRDEWEKERKEREKRDGSKDRSGEREARGDWGI